MSNMGINRRSHLSRRSSENQGTVEQVQHHMQESSSSRSLQGLELSIPPMDLENGSNSFPLIRAEENGSPFIPPAAPFNDISSVGEEEALVNMELINVIEEHFRLISYILTPEAILEGLDFRKYRSDKLEANGEQERCCICLDELVAEQYLVKLDCNHHYHFNCIKRWLLEKNQCPICRAIGISLF